MRTENNKNLGYYKKFIVELESQIRVTNDTTKLILDHEKL